MPARFDAFQLLERFEIEVRSEHLLHKDIATAEVGSHERHFIAGSFAMVARAESANRITDQALELLRVQISSLRTYLYRRVRNHVRVQLLPASLGGLHGIRAAKRASDHESNGDGESFRVQSL